MGHTFTNLLTHIIFSTKDRRALIRPDFKLDLHAYLGGIIRQLGGTALIVNGMPDHVHILTLLPTTKSPAEMVNKIKANSSKWLREKHAQAEFAWQTGYSAFAVSESNRDDVIRYITKQQQHHATRSFQDELISYLKKHRIPYDERYIWS